MQQLTLSDIFRPPVKDSNTRDTAAKSSVIYKFNTWIKTQEEYRLLWLGIAVLGGIATVLPLTLLAVVFWANNSLTLWAITLSVNVPVLVLNLAWFIDAVIVFYCLALYVIM
jgi:hypothetical protein